MLQKMKNRAKENKGFTLIEMIIVIAIIAILIALIAPNLMKYLDTANQRRVDAAAKTLYTSVNTYVVDQRAEGNAVDTTAAKWVVKAGDAPVATNPIDTVLAEYFNASEILDNNKYKMDCTVTFTSSATGAVQVDTVTWHEDGSGTGTYPQ